MDFIKKNSQWISAILICLLLTVYGYGCEPKTTSLITTGKKVNAAELETEFEILLLQHESRTADINRQIEIRNLIFQQGLLIAESGTVNPIGIITSLVAVLGIGAAVDDVRLRKKIKKT